MMYYREALILQCFLEYAGDNAIFSGFWTTDFQDKDKKGLFEYAQALADLKFTYVVSCQVYGAQKKSKNPKERSSYTNILGLMLENLAVRVAYIDEVEEAKEGKSQKVYYPVLVKGGEKYDEEVYRIKLSGLPVEIGEGKPENQNHAIIFTRGEALQTIDMNQCETMPEPGNNPTSRKNGSFLELLPAVRYLFILSRQKQVLIPFTLTFHEQGKSKIC
ncbi:hypothetical protein AAHE18_11G081600 [Arachis hypogaea]